MGRRMSAAYHILHLDDAPSMAEFCRAVCKAAGWQYTWWSAPPPALVERVRTLRPDVLVLDINMPGMDGLEAAALLKADAATQRIPIIFLTTMTGDWYHREATRLGAAYYLVKSATTAADLRNAVQACVQS